MSKGFSLVLLNEFYRHRLRCVKRGAKVAACSAEASFQSAGDGVREHLRKCSDTTEPGIVDLSGAWSSDQKFQGRTSAKLVTTSVIGGRILLYKGRDHSGASSFD